MLLHFFGVISVTEVEFGSQAMMFSKIFVIMTRVIMSSTSVPDNRLLWVCAKFRKFLNTSCFPFVPLTRTQLGRQSFHIAAPTVWNALPSQLRSSSISLGQFRAGLKTRLFTWAYGHLRELLLKSALFHILHYILHLLFATVRHHVCVCA